MIQGAGEVRPAPAPVDAPDDPAGALPGAVATAGGLLCAAAGVAVMAAWCVRATTVVTFGSQSAMAFDTALALAVTGAALVALARGRPMAAAAAGVFDVLLGATVLAEYALGRGLGIDQLFVHDYIGKPHHPPGRMAFSAALCVLLSGAALLAWGPWRSRRRPVMLAAAGSFTAVIAVAATFGYATTSPAAHGWTYATTLPLPTAAIMLVLALSLLAAAWQDSRTDRARLPGWLPMACGAVALGLALWQAIDGQAVDAGGISAGIFTGVATVLGVVLAGLVAIVVRLGQQADRRRRVAVAEAARRSGAELAARESENLLFRFLDALPVGVHITLPGGQP
jgi:hypothetical protein